MKNLLKTNPVFVIGISIVLYIRFFLTYELDIVLNLFLITLILIYFRNKKLILVSIILIFFIILLRLDSFSNISLKNGEKEFLITEKTSDNYYTAKLESIYINLYSEYDLIPGYYYKAELKIQPLNNTVNFLEFDYSKYLFSKKIFFRAYSRNFSITDKKSKIYYYQNRIRDFFRKDQKDKGVLLACSLVLNDRKSKKSLYPIFQSLNISHFIAFSGMHLGILLSLNEKFLRKTVYFNYMIIIIAYFMSNFSFSCLRSIYIYLSGVFANLIERDGYPLEQLGIFSIFCLIYNPYIVFDPSFFYSVIFFSQLLIFSEKPLFMIFLFAAESLFIMKTLSIYYIFLNYILIFLFPIIILFSISYLFFSSFSFSYYLLIPNRILIKSLEFLVSQNIEIKLNIYSIMIIFSLFFIFTHKRLFLITALTIAIYIRLFPYMLVFDTGHGQSILFNNYGSFVLFDGGNSRYNFDITLENFLKLDTRPLNSVFISHNDSDHYTGLAKIGKKHGYIYIPAQNNFIPDGIVLKDDFYTVKSFMFNAVFYREGNSNSNLSSFFYNINTFGKRIFICSDLNAELSEKFMQFSGNNADIIVIGHHGGKETVSQCIINRNPDAQYIISCSSQYDNPHRSTLDVLKRSILHTTRYNGAIFYDILTGFIIKHRKTIPSLHLYKQLLLRKS